MGQEWKTETSGRVSMIAFAGGTQGGETAMVERMKVSQIQASLISGIGLSEIDSGVAGLQQVPLLFRSLDELSYVMAAMKPKLERRLREKGFVVLTWIDSGWVRIFSKTPILSPEDVMNTKLFTWAGDEPQTNLLKKLGFRPVPLDSTEITSSLQTGLIDTVPMPPFFAMASQVNKPAPYMLEINYVPLMGAVVVSETVWDRISAEDQVVVHEIAEKHGVEMTKNGRTENDQAVEVMKADGLTVAKAEGANLKVWNDLAVEAYSIIRDTTVPADIFDEVIGLLEEYRSKK
tara:strand:+ start:720 stop:1589 length:870 start_codon:yes stop_codon:yes gene_type:complete